MGRPRKARRLEAVPEPVIYIPGGWTKGQEPVEVAIEDFEIMRLVDGRGYGIVEAAEKVGVSRSTAGRMLERCRRAIAQGFEKRAPVYLDASKDLVLEAPDTESTRTETVVHDDSKKLLAIACHDGAEDSPVARIFGRAPEFVVVSGKGKNLKKLRNPGFGVQRNAAAKAVQLLVSEGIGRVVAGRFGPEALRLLGEANIQAQVASGLAVRQAIEVFNETK